MQRQTANLDRKCICEKKVTSLIYAGGLVKALLLVFLVPVLPCVPLEPFFFVAAMFVGTITSSSGCTGGVAGAQSVNSCSTTGANSEDLALWNAAGVSEGCQSWVIKLQRVAAQCLHWRSCV
jgi:hypothetical protein